MLIISKIFKSSLLCSSLAAHWAALISISAALRKKHQLTLQDQGYGASASCGTSQPLGLHQIILLHEQETQMQTTCPRLLHTKQGTY